MIDVVFCLHLTGNFRRLVAVQRVERGERVEPWWVHDAAVEVRGVRGGFTVRGVGADGGTFLF